MSLRQRAAHEEPPWGNENQFHLRIRAYGDALRGQRKSETQRVEFAESSLAPEALMVILVVPERDGQANEFGAEGLLEILEPVGEDEPGNIVRRVCDYLARKSALDVHRVSRREGCQPRRS